MPDEVEVAAPALSELPGAFAESLLRNNKKIRDDRGLAIVESAEIYYKRKIEDLELRIKQMKRDQDNMLDLSPTHADSLVLASDFDAETFTNKDVSIGIQIRQLEIEKEVAQRRYNHLFKGKTV